MNEKNYEEIIFNESIRSKTQVSIFLMNGFQMRSTILAFDESVVIAETDGRQQMIYKHAISTIVPGKYIKGI